MNYEPEKSHVGIFQCFFCGKDMGLLLDKRLRKTLPMHCGAINMDPCDKCKKLLDMRIMLIGYDPELSNPQKREFCRTGQIVVVKPDFIIRNVNDPDLVSDILASGFTFMEKEIMDSLQEEHSRAADAATGEERFPKTSETPEGLPSE